MRLPKPEGQLWIKILIEAARHKANMPEIEILLLVEGLKGYPVELIGQAFDHLRKYPIRGFTGMPSETDLVSTMEQLKVQNAEEDRRAREQRELEEHAAFLKRVNDHPEEFLRVEDAFREVLSRAGTKTSPDRNRVPMPLAMDLEPVSRTLLGIDGGERERELQRQREFLLQEKPA